MMKNDLKLNISELRQVVSGIETERNALLEISEASAQFLAVLKEQDSHAYENLSSLWYNKVQKEEEELSYRLETMSGMVNSYIESMTRCVSPENEGALMRVDKYDIWFNYEQISLNSVDFKLITMDTISSFKDYKKIFTYNPFSSPEENAAKKAKLEAEERKERERRERNYNKLANFRRSLKSEKRWELEAYVREIKSIYERNVEPFVDTDDYYNKQLSAEYDDWATLWDKALDVADVAVDVGSGVLDGLKDVVTGVWGLLKGAVRLVEWGGRKVFGLTMPEELDEEVTKVFKGLKAIVTDPGNALEAIGQLIADTVDEKGMAYSIGYVAADIAVSVAADKGLSKLKELRKAKKLSKVDDVLNVADDAMNLSDDIVNAADNVADMVGDVAKGALDADLLDELAKSGVKCNIDDVVAITKTADGKLVWLEKGNSNAGLEHIMKHAEQFATQGISSEKIPDFLMHALSEGKIVGTQRTRIIYEVIYEGSCYRVAISVGDNGFIVGANPKPIPIP